MRRFFALAASLAAALSLMAAMAAPVGAYGDGAGHDMWQIGISFNCNNPDFCGSNLGGFWGWAELDRSVDGTVTWGDAQLTGCTHSVGGGGFAGAAHISQEIDSWTIEPGSAGLQTFFASGEETDSFRGVTLTSPFTHMDLGVSAVPGHYTASDIFGFDPPPGVAIQIQVAFRPAK